MALSGFHGCSRSKMKRVATICAILVVIGCTFRQNPASTTILTNNNMDMDMHLHATSTLLPHHTTRTGAMDGISSKNDSKNTLEGTEKASSLLTVPFYVYEELVWHNFTFGNQTLEEKLAKTPLKQSEDFWFMKASLQHPLRTLDPEKARLFVVPTLMNFVSDGIAEGIPDPTFQACHDGLCNEELLQHTTEILSKSPYYQRSNGKDHIMVLSNWYSTIRPDLFQQSLLATLNMIRFEDRIINNSSNRFSFPSTYVGNPCNVSSETKTSDFVFVGSLWEDAPRRKKKRFRARRQVCKWLWQQSQKTTTVSACGSGVDQCPAVAQARYGFHIRGDTYGANRLLDTLLSGTVPVFAHWEEQYRVLPDWIDWELLSVRVNVTSKQEFLDGIDTILTTESNDKLNQTDMHYYETKHRHVLANRDLLDWRTGVAFDVYMFMFQRQILPSTVPSKVVNPYPFSALKID